MHCYDIFITQLDSVMTADKKLPRIITIMIAVTTTAETAMCVME